MTYSNYKILNLVLSAIRRIDLGHIILVAIIFSGVVYFNNLLQTTTTTASVQTADLKDELTLTKAKVYVLEEEYFRGPPLPDSLSEDEYYVHLAYVKKKEKLIRDMAIPVLMAHIEQARPKSEKYKETWKAAGLPTVKEMADIYYSAAKKYDLDPTFLVGITWAESRFRVDVCTGKKTNKRGKVIKVVSTAGAVGCMQIMPQWIGEADQLKTEEDLTTFKNNVFAGADILRRYLDSEYGKGQYDLALILYNYGPDRFAKRIRRKLGFNDYNKSVIRKVKRLKQIVPVEITIPLVMTSDNLNPM